MQRKSFFILLMVVFLTTVLLGGCGASPGTQETAQTNTITLGGSSTLAPIIAECADGFMEEFKTWNHVDPSFPEEAIVIFVSTGGSGFGVRSTLDGTFDIGLVARDLREQEETDLAEGRVLKLASDVLTIAVNPNNPLTSVKTDLTRDEIRDIFSGAIKTWNQLDASLPNTPIVLAIRDLGGGASEIFDAAVMHGTPVSDEAQQMPSMGALGAKVMENDAAIGYVSSGLVNQNPDKLVALSVDGIAPTLENINQGVYDIGRPLLLIAKSNFTPQQQAFIDYLQSEKGHQVISNLGYIPAE